MHPCSDPDLDWKAVTGLPPHACTHLFSAQSSLLIPSTTALPSPHPSPRPGGNRPRGGTRAAADCGGPSGDALHRRSDSRSAALRRHHPHELAAPCHSGHELSRLHDTQGAGDTWQTIPKTLGRGIPHSIWGIQGSSKEDPGPSKRHLRPLNPEPQTLPKTSSYTILD